MRRILPLLLLLPLAAPAQEPGLEGLAKLPAALIQLLKLEEPLEDVKGRLAANHQSALQLQLPAVSRVHSDPLLLLPESRRLLDDLENAKGPTALLAACDAWLEDRTAGPVPAPPAPTADGLADWLGRVSAKLDEAFSGLSLATRDAMGQDLRLAAIQDYNNLAAALNLPTPDTIRGCVNLAALREAGILAATVADPAWLADLRKSLEEDWKAQGSPPGLFLERETPQGRILAFGSGASAHKEKAAVLIDLGGNDVYEGTAGASAAGLPVCLLIDYEGNDEYRSQDLAQGSGRLGVGMLLDLKGDDRYTARDHAQGAATLGIGLLWDAAGKDAYESGQVCQGTAFGGIGILLDEGGNDRYTADRFAQGTGLPVALGLLLDRAGDDRYLIRAKYRTGYTGTEWEGAFDGFGQGFGFGIRNHAGEAVDPGTSFAGGIGALVDSKGDDQYEAPLFTMGCGYFFGWGLLRDRAGNDRFAPLGRALGSGVHEASGYAEDLAGNDTHKLARGSGLGEAWDEASACFLDAAGNDVHDGGGYTALGTGAHNGVSIFLDLKGSDTYRMGRGCVGGSGMNTYHGGRSVGLFLDLGSEKDADSFEGVKGVTPKAVCKVEPDGGAADPPLSLEKALAKGALEKFLKAPEDPKKPKTGR